MREKLEKRIAAFFDLDLTVTDRDSLRYFLKNQYLDNPQKWPMIPYVVFWGIMRKLRIISLRTFKEKALVLLRGYSVSDIEEVGKNFLENYLIYSIRKNAIGSVRWHNKKGHFTYIISASPDIYISSITNYLGCNGYDCTKLFFQNNKFTGELDGSDCLGIEKIKRIRAISIKENLDLAKSYAYSDHESDLPFLGIVGYPVAVSPTVKLRKISADRGWRVEEW